jgi:hypothetical protein
MSAGKANLNDASDIPDNQVYNVASGQFIAFWRGQVVRKLDDTLRYFDTEQAAWGFLARRDSVTPAARRTVRAKPADRP